MDQPVFFDATHTSHTRAQTGIQRVTRSLFAELSKIRPVTGVCFDPYGKVWRSFDQSESAHMALRQPVSRSRGSRWSFSQKLSGRVRRLLSALPALPEASGLVCPELFSPKVGRQLPVLFAHVRGPKVAIFHDAIGLKLPEMTPAATVARLPGYMHELLQFDGIAAVSEDSASSLRDYWKWVGVSATPQIQAIPNALDFTPAPPASSAASGIPRLLSVGTIEGRKNHLALLQACDDLWREGLIFELELIGAANHATAREALDKIRTLQQKGRALIYSGSASDEALAQAYTRCSFTIYPSLMEGFGLPVLESLRYGKPCICSSQGALGECARDGGCLALDSVDPRALGHAIRRLLQNPEELAALTTTAQSRVFRSWSHYATELTDWMLTLPAGSR